MDCCASPRTAHVRKVLRGESEDIDFIDDAYAKAVSEWNLIQPLPILTLSLAEDQERDPEPASEDRKEDRKEDDGKDDVVAACKPCSEDHASLDSFITYAATTDVSKELPHIVARIERSRLTCLFRRLFLVRKPMKTKLKRDRNRIFALALKPFDNEESIHVNMLICVYQSLKREPEADCPRIGSHWETIGFQGVDPASDLRGVGILGLIQLSFFVMSQETQRLARDIFDLSTERGPDFPFCVMGLNMTQIALQCLREGSLNREMNRSRNPLLTFNLFYASLYLRLFAFWRMNQCTVVDTGFVLRNLKRSASKSVQKSILSVFSYKGTKEASEERLVVFSDIGNIMDPEVKGGEEENLV